MSYHNRWQANWRALWPGCGCHRGFGWFGLAFWVGCGIDLCVAFNICGFALLQQSERDDATVVWRQHRRGRSRSISISTYIPSVSESVRVFGVQAIDCTQQGGKLKCIREWSAASVVCSSPKSAGQITGLPGERVDVLSLCELWVG